MKSRKLCAGISAGALSLLAALTMGASPATADARKAAPLWTVGNGPCIIDMNVVAENRSAKPGITTLTFQPAMRGLGDTCSTDVRVEWAQSQSARPTRGTRILNVTAQAAGSKPHVIEFPTGPGITGISVKPVTSPLANLAGGSSHNDFFLILRTG